MTAQNKYKFSYKRILGNSLLVVIPHQDDEINVAGATITGAVKEGINVRCVYLTNGDWSYRASVRIHEAIKALSVLGVEKSHITILGYPDGGLHTQRNIYTHGQFEPVTVNGRNSTYGAASISDFSFILNRKHSFYTWDNLINDLMNVILKYRPDSIIGTDFDYHPDHRMTLFALEKALNKILHQKVNRYYPRVFYGFAYATAYESVDDFYDINLKSSVIKKENLCICTDETDNPTYRWNDRIRFPVPISCSHPLLFKNKLFWALTKHVSQRGYQKARKIINSDQVFWERRTDNLALKGDISVSSGNAAYLNDFQRFQVRDIEPHHVIFNEGLWEPAEADNKKSIKIRFDKPESISSIILYGNIEDTGRILQGQFTFSDGSVFMTGALAKRGRATQYVFKPKKVKWLEYRILKLEGKRAGIGEIEVFQNKFSDLTLIGVTVNGNLTNKWNKLRQEKIEINVELYPLNYPVKWFLNNNEINLEKLNAYVNSHNEICHIRVEYQNLMSECLIVPRGKAYLLRWNILRKIDRAIYLLEHGKQKVIHRLLKRYRDQH